MAYDVSKLKLPTVQLSETVVEHFTYLRRASLQAEQCPKGDEQQGI